jgi:uncharacterized protein YhbP (UPF0306 family)
MAEPTVHPPIDKKILSFIARHHQFVLATVVNNTPWTANCFYAWIQELSMFVFTSDLHTRHAGEMLQNKLVAGNISLETGIIGKIQGLQFSGSAFLLEGEKLDFGKKSYLKRFPVALLMETTLWGFDPDHFKLTDNRLGFGKKLIWQKNQKIS